MLNQTRFPGVAAQKTPRRAWSSLGYPNMRSMRLQNSGEPGKGWKKKRKKGDMKQVTRSLAVMTVLATGLCATAGAISITYSGSSGNLSAEATFDLTGTTLTVTLTNTSLFDVLVPSEVLTAVFFDVAGSGALTMGTATLTGGSSVAFFPPPGTDVSPEWAYVEDEGISSAGFGLFGPGDRFDTSTDLWAPASPDGLQYGILPLADNLTTGNTPVTGSQPLIVGGVQFTFTVASGFALSDIGNVSFQYGTSLTEPNIPHTPEPASLALLGMGIAGLLFHRSRKVR